MVAMTTLRDPSFLSLRRILAFALFVIPTLCTALVVPKSDPHCLSTVGKTQVRHPRLAAPLFLAKPKGQNNLIGSERRKQLGINDDEDEYDLYFALDQNTDPLITKLIAGSFIVAITGLLVAGIVVPSLTDYGDGVCNPLLTAGRC